MFHGLNFYNLKLNNLKIQHFFIKIHKKIIIKANGIRIIPQQSIKKDITTFHKRLHSVKWLMNFIEKIDAKDFQYKDIKIPEIYFTQKTLFINSNLFYLKGKIKPYRKYLILNNFNIKYENINIKDLNGKINFEDIISFNLTAYINGKNKINLKGELNDKDILTAIVSSKKLSTNYKDFKIDISKFILSLYADLKYKNISASAKGDELFIKNKKDFIKLNSVKIDLTNKKAIFNILKAKGEYKKIKAYTDFLKGTYFLKEKLLIISKNNKINLHYQDINATLFENEIVFKNKHNLNFSSKKITLIKKDIYAKADNAFLMVFDDFITYKINNNIIKNAFLKIIIPTIYGKYNLISIPTIKIKYKNLNPSVQNILINTKTKKAVIETIKIKSFTFTPTFIDLNGSVLNVRSSSNSVKINNDLKQILKEFNISLPLQQLRGKNHIYLNASIDIDKKIFHIKHQINSKNSLFKYENSIFGYNKLQEKGKDLNFSVKLKDLNSSFDIGKIILDSNLTINPQFLNSFTKIKTFKILNLVNIKNFNEKIVIDFKNHFLYLLNSTVMADLKNLDIYVYSIKKFIKYTPFSFLKDGDVYIHILKNQTLLITKAILKKPLLLNKKNPNCIDAKVEIDKDTIKISNNNIKVTITNLNHLKADIKNVDINIETLLEIIDTVDNLIPKSKYQTSDTNFYAIVNSTNTNLIYKNHKFLSQKATLEYNDTLKFTSKYKKSSLEALTKDNILTITGYHYQKEELSALLEFFNSFKEIDLDFKIIKPQPDLYIGYIKINHAINENLKALNNLIAFLNTVPSLLSLKSPGFSSKGYKIKYGYIKYVLYNNILYFDSIKIIGKNIDFKGKGTINLETNEIMLKLQATLKMKYKKIPIVGKGISHILFGKDGNINVKLIVKGDLNNPKVSSDIGKDIILSPFNIFKRTLTLPFNLF